MSITSQAGNVLHGYSIFVKSLWIRQISYNPFTQRLRVQTKTDGVYDYHNVPWAVARALYRAKSKGSAYNGFIKGAYDVTKVRAPRVSSL